MYDKPLKLVYLHRSARSFHLSTTAFTTISALATGIMQTTKTKSTLFYLEWWIFLFSVQVLHEITHKLRLLLLFFLRLCNPGSRLFGGREGYRASLLLPLNSSSRYDTVHYFVLWRLTLFAGVLSHWTWYSSMKVIICPFWDIRRGIFAAANPSSI